MMSDETALEKFKGLLRKLFRIDLQDLDFGIYKIMRAKQKMILDFIDNELVSSVNSILNETNEGEDLSEQVFNLAYEFFSRYYSNGDFIPQVRYGGKDKYMIPYNGQEIELHWATKNAYYVKTTENFTNYSFVVFNPLEQDDKYQVNFKIKGATLDKNYIESENKFLILDDIPTQLSEKTLNIFFNYRSLNETEKEKFLKNEKTLKEQLKRDAEERILQNIKGELKDLLSASSNDPDVERNNLRRHLDIYFRKINSDYFIIKNLNSFLSTELQNFIKSEIVIFNTELQIPKKNLLLGKAVYSICSRIINQISQIEEFEIRLWEKPKFAYNVNYIITLDKLESKECGIDLIKKLVKSGEFKSQKNEWISLNLISPDFSENDLFDDTLVPSLNNKYRYLTFDTKYFKNFENDILAIFNDLNNELDGFLFHSENYQTLNTIKTLFKEKIKTIYIDPPYNTGSDGFLYKDKFQDSSWLTMLDNRIFLAKSLMKDDSAIFVSMGDTIKNDISINSTSRLQLLLNEIYGERNYIATFVRKSGIAPRQDIGYIANSQDYVFLYSKNKSFLQLNKKEADNSRLKYKDEYFNKRGNFDLNQLDRGSKNYSSSLDYPIIVEPGQIIEMLDSKSFKKLKAQERIEIWPAGDKNDKRWIFTWSKDKVEWGIKNGFIVFKNVKDDRWKAYYKEYELVDNNDQLRSRENPYDTLVLNFTNEIGSKEIINLFGERRFEYPKPSEMIEHFIKMNTNANDFVLDFFAGSGTTVQAVMQLNKRDKGKRKFILVEVADYFDSIIIPRIKKLSYSFNWDNGTPKDNNGDSIFIKYYNLEQYEDSLNNIKINENDFDNLSNSGPIRYILKMGFLDSTIFINREMLSDPFNMKMEIVESGVKDEVDIDLVETFNLWHGVEVNRVLSFIDDKRKYLFIFGMKSNQRLIIVWRSTVEIDFKRDNDFIINILKKNFKIDDRSVELSQILINSETALDLSDYNISVRSLDPIFYNMQFRDIHDE